MTLAVTLSHQPETMDLKSIVVHLLVGWFCLAQKEFEQVMNHTFAYLEPKNITEHFFHPGKRNVLPCVEVTNKAFGT
jgi:hypothetical protein